MKKYKKSIIFLISAMMIFVSLITGYAYLSKKTGSLENTFVEETNENIIVQNSAVNIGSPGYAVYVRAAVVINWQDSSGNVYAYSPVDGTDYLFTINDEWIKGTDGFYYYKPRISSGTTEALFSTFTSSATAPNNYELHVEIISQTIQALGKTDADDTFAVIDSWNVILDTDGNIIGVNP